jgi:hypothetical protein
VIAACVSVQYRLNDSDGRTMTILLTTLNARYAHAALGLRYLLANMGELTEQTTIQEFVIGLRPTDIVEKFWRTVSRIRN